MDIVSSSQGGRVAWGCSYTCKHTFISGIWDGLLLFGFGAPVNEVLENNSLYFNSQSQTLQ